MDKIDSRLLGELIKNSRIAITTLAKRLKTSREVATYRLNKLKREGILLDYVTEIDTIKLGFLSAALFINIKANKEREFSEFIKKSNFASWSGEFSGVWRFGLDIYGKTNEEIHDNFQMIYHKFKDDIIDHRLTLYKNKLFFHEKYLNEKTSSQLSGTFKKFKIDEKDKLILQKLSTNSRLDSVELSSIVNLTTPAVIQRIRNLEKRGLIKKYSAFIDVTKLGLFQYSVFITNKNIDDKNKLLGYLSAHSKVPFIAEYIGDPFLEFGVVVKDPYELRKVLQEIEESFPDNRIIEVFLIQKEFISIGPPASVFN